MNTKCRCGGNIHRHETITYVSSFEGRGWYKTEDRCVHTKYYCSSCGREYYKCFICGKMECIDSMYKINDQAYCLKCSKIQDWQNYADSVSIKLAKSTDTLGEIGVEEWTKNLSITQLQKTIYDLWKLLKIKEEF